jgi:hypothetical protein
MTDDNRPHMLRFRLRTLLLVVAIVALLTVVVIQQVQIGRMRHLIDAHAKQRDQLTTIVRELRDRVERHR